MKIYNSITNKLEDFKPINEGIINMYVCGPTVNKRTHIGHMYPVIFFDMVYRYFLYLGYKVNYASNFTDVDDKIIKTALEEGVTEKEIADRYSKLYLEDIKKVNCLEVTYRPKVTEYMNDIIKTIQLLLDKGFAYKKGNDVYLDVSKVNGYGILSNQVVENLNYGNRIDVSENKENPYDFVLWKETTEGIKWQAPFGTGRPGWHTECVVMINKLFGGKIDIHGGGIDLKFPHHENEVAQAKCLWNNTLANYWIHNGHLMLDGVKMSKSLGNILTIDDILKKYDANTLRITILKNHYRLPLNFGDDILKESDSINNKIKNGLKNAIVYISVNNLKIGKIKKDEKTEEYLDDDFNTANLFTYLLELIKILNINIKNKDNTNITKLFDKILLICNILGLVYKKDLLTSDEILEYNNWIDARNNKDFLLADKLRNELIEKEII